MQQNDDENDGIPILEPVKKLSFFQRLFGKKDTTAKSEVKKDNKKEAHSTLVDYGDGIIIDTAGKTKKEIRQEKRAMKKQQKELQDQQKQNNN